MRVQRQAIEALIRIEEVVVDQAAVPVGPSWRAGNIPHRLTYDRNRTGRMQRFERIVRRERHLGEPACVRAEKRVACRRMRPAAEDHPLQVLREIRTSAHIGQRRAGEGGARIVVHKPTGGARSQHPQSQVVARTPLTKSGVQFRAHRRRDRVGARFVAVIPIFDIATLKPEKRRHRILMRGSSHAPCANRRTDQGQVGGVAQPLAEQATRKRHRD